MQFYAATFIAPAVAHPVPSCCANITTLATSLAADDVGIIERKGTVGCVSYAVLRTLSNTCKEQ